MKILFSVLVTFCFGTAAFSQFAIGGGPALLKAFGVKSPYIGLSVIGEVPMDEQSSYYGKLGYFGKQQGANALIYAYAIDVNTAPQVLSINSRQTFNYITIEGGRRYYFGNGYDYGFAPYGGTHLMAVFNQITQTTDNFDKSKYTLNGTGTGSESRGSIFNLAFGLSGGLKNDFAWGTLYLDVAFDYFILSKATNQAAVNGYNELGSSVLFTFGVGYKKSIF